MKAAKIRSLNILVLLGLLLIETMTATAAPIARDFGAIHRANVNGMTVLLQPNTSPLTEVVLMLKSGSSLAADTPGAAELMNNLVYLKLMSERSGKVNVSTYPDFTLIKIEVASEQEYIAETLKEIAGLLKYPLYSYDIIADLKSLYETELKFSPPIMRAYGELNRKFYGENHPYNERFSSEDIVGVTGNAVYEWYRRAYRTGNAVLSISGGATPEIAEIEDAFEQTDGAAADYRRFVKPVMLSKTQMTVKDDPNGRICTLAMGFSAPRLRDPEYPAFRLLTYYLQEYQHYFEEIRVKDALVYTTLVHYNYLEKPQAPMLCFLTMTAPENLKRVEQRTAEIVRELCEEGLNSEEIAKVAKSFEINCQSKLAGQGTRATENALNYYLENVYVYEENLCSELYLVTPEAVKNAAQKYLQNYVGVALKPGELPDNF